MIVKRRENWYNGGNKGILIESSLGGIYFFAEARKRDANMTVQH